MTSRHTSLLLGLLIVSEGLQPSASLAQSPSDPLPPRTEAADQTHHDPKAKSTEAQSKQQIDRQQLAIEETKSATKQYWSSCVANNRRFIKDKSDVWFKEFRPDAVELTLRDAAKRLRALDKTNVDGRVLDHVNLAIRGFENMGAIVKIKGKESLRNDALGVLNFIRFKSPKQFSGAVVDGGLFETGPALTEGGKAATREGQLATTKIASDLVSSEEETIRAMRESYKIELEPW